MNLPALVEAPAQPEVSILISGGVFVKSHVVALANMFMPQHSHVYDHVSYIASGSVRVWAGGEPLGDVKAPRGIIIKAGVKHLFQTLEPNTTILCIHNIADADGVEIAEAHEIT